ncbi:BHLH domain-containing protein [Aphelenchoides besseyi]|nr:BHLH domain-containing protein [Aphelenchoides besseyi]
METQSSNALMNGTASGSQLANSESQHTTFTDSIQSKILGGKIANSEEKTTIPLNVIEFNNYVVRGSSKLTQSNDVMNHKREDNKPPKFETPSEYSETNTTSSHYDQQDDDELLDNTKQESHDPSPIDGQSMLIDDRRMRRQIANCNERRRMQSINAGFQALRQFLPQRCGEKLSKAAILQQTAELIQTLKLEKERLITGTSDMERPQCKKRRIDDKKPTESLPADQSSTSNNPPTTEYLRVIEELRIALEREQQLRLLYERKFTELKTSVLSNLNAAASSISDLPARNDVQLNMSPLHRSHSVETPIAKAAFRELPCTAPSTPISNIVAAAEAALLYNNAVLNAAKQPHQTNSRYNGLLTGVHVAPESRFTNAITSSLSLRNPPTLQIQNAFGENLPLNSALTCSTNDFVSGPLTPHLSPDRSHHLAALLNAIRQLESDSGKNFVSEGLSNDVLVR